MKVTGGKPARADAPTGSAPQIPPRPGGAGDKFRTVYRERRETREHRNEPGSEFPSSVPVRVFRIFRGSSPVPFVSRTVKTGGKQEANSAGRTANDAKHANRGTNPVRNSIFLFQFAYFAFFAVHRFDGLFLPRECPRCRTARKSVKMPLRIQG